VHAQRANNHAQVTLASTSNKFCQSDTERLELVPFLYKPYYPRKYYIYEISLSKKILHLQNILFLQKAQFDLRVVVLCACRSHALKELWCREGAALWRSCGGIVLLRLGGVVVRRTRGWCCPDVLPFLCCAVILRLSPSWCCG
jgi:hypothetical protein